MKAYTSERCDRHRSPAGYPEQPSRRLAVVDGLREAGLDVAEVPETADPGALEEAIGAVHTPEYVRRLERAVARGDGLIDSADNPLSAGTWEGARAAVDVALTALEAALAGDPSFAVVRPPGHHAEADLAMGFCYFNNAAIAARHAQRSAGVDRVAIFDFDVHHGNGTQHVFERDGSVFYASTHQFPFYPGTGAASEVGIGEGEGATLNVPLKAGTDDEGYAEAIRTRVLPALERFAPNLLVLSAGFDAWCGDPLGGMRVSVAGFRSWGIWCRDLAERVCGGRLLALLEGGYDVASLPAIAAAFAEGVGD